MNRGRLIPLLKRGAKLYVASMRPRFMNRGRDSTPQVRPARIRASMRPRFMNRGRTRTRSARVGAPTPLQ